MTDQNYDLYKVLGVSKSSELYTIKGAYIKKAALWHPDRNAHTPTLARSLHDSTIAIPNIFCGLLGVVIRKKFQQVQNAFAILSNEDTRRSD